MQTLGLVNGDLAIDGSGGYLMVSGADRIRQDLTLGLLEEYGTDRFHPKFGSTVKTYLGNPITPELQQLVQAEVNRVVQNYILIQQAEVIRGSQFDLAGRFDTSDVVQAVTSINVRTDMDAIFVSVALQTIARETVSIRRQVAGV